MTSLQVVSPLSYYWGSLHLSLRHPSGRCLITSVDRAEISRYFPQESSGILSRLPLASCHRCTEYPTKCDLKVCYNLDPSWYTSIHGKHSTKLPETKHGRQPTGHTINFSSFITIALSSMCICTWKFATYYLHSVVSKDRVKSLFRQLHSDIGIVGHHYKTMVTAHNCLHAPGMRGPS